VTGVTRRRERARPENGSPPAVFWFGVFLVLYSAPFLLNLLYITTYPGWRMQSQSVLLGLTGAALFAASWFVMSRGLMSRQARLALAAAALLIGLTDIYPRLVYGNPFSWTAGFGDALAVAVGLVGSLALAAAGAWFVGVALGRPEAHRTSERAALIFAGAFALQKGVVPLVNVIINFARDVPATVAVISESGLAWAAYILPLLVRAAAGGIALWALWPVVKPEVLSGLSARGGPAVRAEQGGEASPPSLAARVPLGPAALAVALWAAGEFLTLVSLWSAWSGGLTAPPPLALRLQTSLLIALPAAALLALASSLLKQGRPGAGPARAGTG